MRNRSGFGWLDFLIGVLLLALGVLAFAQPDLALTGLVCAYGIAAVVMGVADLLLYIRVERYTGFGPVLSLISGIVSVMSGIMLVAYPRTGVLVLTVLFPLWFIAHCISRLTHLNHIRLVAGEGIYTLVLGFLMLLSPLFTLTTIRCFAGVYLILLGIDSIAMAMSPMGRRW